MLHRIHRRKGPVMRLLLRLGVVVMFILLNVIGALASIPVGLKGIQAVYRPRQRRGKQRTLGLSYPRCDTSEADS
jgi:hypothetical protein